MLFKSVKTLGDLVMQQHVNALWDRDRDILIVPHKVYSVARGKNYSVPFLKSKRAIIGA